MNDSKDFQDAESVRSGNSHVTNQPGLFPKHPAFEGMLRRSFVSPRRREGPPDIWDTSGFFRKRFCKSTSFLFSSLSPGIEFSLEEHWGAVSHVYCGEKWTTRTGPRSEMPIWTVRQKFSQWRRLFKELWGRPTTTAHFRSSFWQVPYASNLFACWKIRFKTEVCTCSQFCTEAVQWIKEVELVDSVDDLRSSSSVRGIPMPNFEVLDLKPLSEATLATFRNQSSSWWTKEKKSWQQKE